MDDTQKRYTPVPSRPFRSLCPWTHGVEISFALGGLHLVVPRLGIGPSQGQQLRMVARFDDAPGLHDMDHICVHGRGKSVGDDEGGVLRGQCAESLQPIVLGPRVHGARRLIEDQNGARRQYARARANHLACRRSRLADMLKSTAVRL